jgi:hypothetical protein
VAQPLCTLLSKILLVLWTFLNVLQFYSAISIYPFVSYLQPTSHASIFILCSFTIKPPVHKKHQRMITRPQKLSLDFACPLSLRHTFMQLCLTLHYFALLCPISHYIILSQIHLGILHIHIISYISFYLIGCWRKGWPVLALFFHFAGLSHCKHINDHQNGLPCSLQAGKTAESNCPTQ